MTYLWRELVVENPMLDEWARARRRFLRSGDKGCALNLILVATFVIIYGWFMLQILLSAANDSAAILMVQLFGLTLIAPSMIYGAVAGEREKSTWEALILTRLTPAQIIAGKLLWRIGIAALLMALILVPLLCSQVAYKGPRDPNAGGIVAVELTTFAWIVLLYAFGLWISSRSRRGVTAIGVILGSMLGFLAAVPSLCSMFSIGDDPLKGTADTIAWLLIQCNPFWSAMQIISPDSPGSPGYILRHDLHWVVLLPCLYLVLAAIFVRATHKSLRQLEEPKRRNEK